MARLSPAEVAGAIDRFNVAGLCDPAKATGTVWICRRR